VADIEVIDGEGLRVGPGEGLCEKKSLQIICRKKLSLVHNFVPILHICVAYNLN